MILAKDLLILCIFSKNQLLIYFVFLVSFISGVTFVVPFHPLTLDFVLLFLVS